jgi:oligoribonuclease
MLKWPHKKIKPMDLLVFLDCEMSGLDPSFDVITEIAMVVVHGSTMQPLGEFSSVIYHPENVLESRLSDWCKKTHEKNGLLREIRHASPVSKSIHAVELAAEQFLQQFRTPTCNPCFILCGNKIEQQDKRFIDKYMPTLAKYFHHVSIELNVFLKCAKLWCPSLRAHTLRKVLPIHRALSDAKSSFNLALYFRQLLFLPKLPPSPPVTAPIMIPHSPQLPRNVYYSYPPPFYTPNHYHDITTVVN